MICIYFKEDNKVLADADSNVLVFGSETAARNYLFSCGYKIEFVESGVSFPELFFQPKQITIPMFLNTY